MLKQTRSGQTPRPTELTSPSSYVLLIKLIIKLLAIYLIPINTLLVDTSDNRESCVVDNFDSA